MFRALRLILCALAVWTSGCAAPPLVERVESSGRRLVLLLDASTSMRRTDPDANADLGVGLIAGLVGSEDNLGVITYAAEPTVRVPMRAVGRSRARIGQALADVPRNGITDFAAGLTAAQEMLVASKAPPGSAVILLTDGVPYRARRGRTQRDGPGLSEVLDGLKAKGWRIFAIALGAEADTPFLSAIVARTGGAVFPAADAGGLVTAFEEVATEALGYLRAQRRSKESDVVPHSGRVAFLGEGKLGEVQREGKPVAEERVIRTAAGRGHHVALVEQPEPGKWTVAAEGAQNVVALLEPRFSLEFLPQQPPERVGALATVPLALRLVGDAQALAKVGPRLLVRAKLELGGRTQGRAMTLKKQPDGTYAGSFRAPFVQKEASLRIVIEAVLVESGRPYVLRRTRSLTVKPGDGKNAPLPLEVAVTPASVTQTLWGDERPGRVAFTITGDPARDVTLRIGRRRRTLKAKGTLTITPRLPRASGVVRLRGKSADKATWEHEVPVTLTRYRLAGKTTIAFPPTPIGLPIGPLPLGLSVSPKAELVYGSCLLRGPGGAELQLTHGPQGLTGTAPAGLRPGTFRGHLVVSLAGVAGLAPKRLPVTLKFLPALRKPDPIALVGSFGWTTATVEVAWPTPSGVPVSITPGALLRKEGGGTIHPALDIRVQPLDGWSGKTLGAQPRKFALAVYVSSDLPPGAYQGSVAITGKGGAAITIPVALEVKR